MILFSRAVLSHYLPPHGLKHTRLPCPSPSPGACSNSCPLSQWCHPPISTSVIPFLLPSVFRSIRVFSNESFLPKVAKVLELQHQSFPWIFTIDFLQNGLVGSPGNPRDFEESSPTPQFKSINSSVLSLLYGPTLISIWLLENHIFDYMDSCVNRLKN